MCLLRLYDELHAHFGPQHWWPGDTPWEVTVGAVLTQNTNWGNVERAIATLKRHGVLGPAPIAAMDPRRLAVLIRPSGYFNVKARRLKNLARWWLAHAPAQTAAPDAVGCLRASLLGVVGVGPETADSILLYAFGLPTFVVDAYTRRFLTRHGLIAANTAYDDVKALFEAGLPRDVSLYNEFHALIVALGKHLGRPHPRCAGCPLRRHLPPGGADFLPP